MTAKKQKTIKESEKKLCALLAQAIGMAADIEEMYRTAGDEETANDYFWGGGNLDDVWRMAFELSEAVAK